MSTTRDWKLVSLSTLGSLRETAPEFWFSWALFLIITALIVVPFDFALFRWVECGRFLGASRLAEFLAQTGKNEFLNIIGTFILMALFFIRKDRRMRRVAISFLLASILSGISVQIIKPLIGRPRPSECIEKHIDSVLVSGPTLRNRLHSYPSGHTATTAAACAVVAIAFPRLVVPCILITLAMAWSRIYGQNHFPVDTLHGAVIGYLSAFLCTRWLDRPPSPASDQDP